MRVLITLLALVSAPFLASVSQEPAGQSSVLLPEAADDGQCVASEHSNAPSHTWRGTGNGQHLANGWAKQAQRADACDAPPPPPSGGVGEIDGTSYRDGNHDFFQDAGELGQGGWIIELRNALTGVVITTTVTSDGLTPPLGLGDYRFQNLAAGTYLVCERPQIGWAQTEPGTERTGCALFPGSTGFNGLPSLAGFGYTVGFTAPLPTGTTFSSFNNFGNAPITP